MPKKYQRSQRRKAVLRQILVLFVLCLLIALGLVLVRSCSANMKPTYNDSYQPMDTHRIKSGSEN
ncbi:MAG: hypothetical protein COA61_001510 [Zetaproteobacteria bacterium]|nr:hypothetical protein [Zetaproteobacteria bacterium]